MGSLFGSGQAALAPQNDAPEDERRQLTVLFYDVVGSTAMLRDMDPEDIRETLMRVHDVCRTQITANSGTLEQVLGDGGMAYFGYPQPHEDAVLQAVETAWDILKARREMAVGARALPDIRIGIATSIVVISTDSSSMRAGGLGAVGVAPNLSARLQSAAQPNAALVDRTTFKLSGRAFDFERVGELTLKGFPDVESAYAIRAQKTLKSRFDRRLVAGTGLIGRTQEMAVLSHAWAETAKAKGGAYLIKGEAGLGKSHLCHAVAKEVEADGAVLCLQCEPSTATVALQPLITMYEHEFSTRDKRDPRSKAAVATAACVHAADADTSLSAQARRAAIVDGCVEILLDLVSTGPFLVLAEDLHWIDEVTLAILHTLAARSKTARVMVVATSRPEADLSLLEVSFENLHLQLFSLSETEALVQAASEGHVTPDALDWITSKSDGNPLFALELSKFVEDQGGSGFRANSDMSVESLRDLLATRLEMAGRSKRAAQIASVIGRDVPFELLSRLVQGKLTPFELDADLSRLVEHGIKEIQENGQIYAFRHALMRDAAYESQLRSTRRELHGRVVDLIENAPELAAVTPMEVIAEHCILAGRLSDGISRLIEAAELAIGRSALTAPRASLERACELMTKLGDPNQARLFELRAISLLGPLVILLDGPRAAAPLYERGQDLCFTLETGARGDWFPILWGWWFTASDLIEQARRSDVLIDSITLDDSDEARLQALHCSWATMFDLGDHDQSLAAVREGLALYNETEARHSRLRYGHDAKVCGLGEMALSLWLQGDGDGARETIAKTLEWAEETEHLPSLLHGLDIATTIAFFRRDELEIKRILTKVASLSGSKEAPAMTAKMQIFDAWFAALSGDNSAHIHVSEGLATLRDLGVLEDTPIYADIASETAILSGVGDKALADLDSEIIEAKRTKLLYWVPELLRRRAAFGHFSNDQSRAEADLDEGLNLALAQNANMLVLRNLATRLDLGLEIEPKIRDTVKLRIESITGAPERDAVIVSLGL